MNLSLLQTVAIPRRIFAVAAFSLSLFAATTQTRPLAELGVLPPPTGDVLGFNNPGDVPTLPDSGTLHIEKVSVTDTRNVKAIVAPPADGRVDSWNYVQQVTEWSANHGWNLPTYETVKNPGIHMTLAPGGFNYLYLRGGYIGSLYRDVTSLDGPGDGKLIVDIKTSTGPEETENYRFGRVAFPKIVDAEHVSFFIRDKTLADAEFLRVGDAAQKKDYSGQIDFHIGDSVPDLKTLGLEFNQLPAPKDDQPPSTFDRRFPRAQDRTIYALQRGAATGTVTLHGGAQVHFLTPILPEKKPIGAVQLNLELAAPQPGNLLNVTVQDPLEGGRELMRVDVRLGNSRRVQCVLDFPDQIMAANRRFWITLGSRDNLILQPDSEISLLQSAPDKALAEYLDYRLYLLRGLFPPMSEARPWSRVRMSSQWLRDFDGKDWYVQGRRQYLLEMFDTMEQLETLAPNNPKLRQYHDFVTTVARPPLEESAIPKMELIPDVPRWAQLLDRTIKSSWKIPEWWMKNRRLNGEFGAIFNDDTDLLQQWTPFAMLDSQNYAPVVREAFRAQSEIGLDSHLKDGLSIADIDALHAYEEGINTMSVMPVLFYGDPRYVEWLMESARNKTKFMRTQPDGSLNFYGDRFGWKNAQKLAETPAANEIPSILLHPEIMLWWYNGSPQAASVITRYLDHFGGYIDKGYNPYDLNYAAYRISGDTKYLGFPKPDANGKYSNLFSWSKRHPLIPANAPEARTQAWWPEYEKLAEDPAQIRVGDWRWAVTRDRSIVEKSFEFALWGNPVAFSPGVERYAYMWTEAQPYADRIFLPTNTIAQFMLGGGNVRNRQWPGFAVSYENLGGDFAALVLDQGLDRLKLTMFNLRETQREGAVRVWQLEPGQYELKIGPDANDDGVMDSVTSTQMLDLKRMNAVPVTLPSRRALIYEFRQLKKYAPLHERPDVAISSADVLRDGANIQVTVHNIGAVDAKNIVVALRDNKGKIVASKVLSSLAAPLDLLPKTATVIFPNVAQAVEVVLDPEGTLTEITELNNEVALPF
jgi:hypothetical protein